MSRKRNSVRTHGLKKIKYEKLNSKQKENYNFQKVAGLLAHYGFNCMRLSDDWQGADFLAYPVIRGETLKVQLKSRLTISKKYHRKGVHIAFPIDECWYLIDHVQLIRTIRRTTSWLKSKSWREKHSYSNAHPGPDLVKALEGFRLKDL